MSFKNAVIFLVFLFSCLCLSHLGHCATPAGSKKAASKTVSKTPAKKPAAVKQAARPSAPKPKPKNASAPPKPVAKSVKPQKTVGKSAVKKTSTPQKRPIKKTSSPSITGPKKSVKPAEASQRLVVLDAGHGGYDLGARLSAINEKSLALSTTLLVKKYLSNMGYRVILTRTRDVFLSLQQRADIANDTKGKLFVSVHYNAAKSTQANGIEVFYYSSKDKYRLNASKKLARIVLNKVTGLTGANSRGVKDGNFFVIRETKMPAILFEGGFITNDDERHKLGDLHYREKIAMGIAEGVDAYFKA